MYLCTQCFGHALTLPAFVYVLFAYVFVYAIVFCTCTHASCICVRAVCVCICVRYCILYMHSRRLYLCTQLFANDHDYISVYRAFCTMDTQFWQKSMHSQCKRNVHSRPTSLAWGICTAYFGREIFNMVHIYDLQPPVHVLTFWVGLARTTYTVYISYFLQGFNQICGHKQRIYTVLANLILKLPQIMFVQQTPDTHTHTYANAHMQIHTNTLETRTQNTNAHTQMRAHFKHTHRLAAWLACVWSFSSTISPASKTCR